MAEKVSRNRNMLNLYINKGMTHEEIGRIYGITRQRVGQIIAKFPEYKMFRDLERHRRELRDEIEEITRQYIKDYNVRERFWSNIDKGENSECWEWTGYIHPTLDYPIYSSPVFERKYKEPRYAHRQLWCMLNGKPVPEDMYIKRKCGNKLCMNPNHVYISDSNR